MVARFGMFHRSLYPALRVARGHYVFCSHVGQPLSVWDKRYRVHAILVDMSMRDRRATHHAVTNVTRSFYVFLNVGT